MLVFDPRNYGANPNDSKDDTAAIQAALDAAHNAGGGHVVLSAGTYTIKGTGTASDGALRIYSNTEISGDGIGKTILKLADGWSAKITGMIRTPVNEITENVIIRDLTLDGNRDNTTADVDGIMTGVLPGKSDHDNNILIERVEIHDVSRIAFNPHEQTHNLTIRDCVAHHNSWDGFIADFIVNGVYENNVAYSNDRHGFNVVTHSNNVLLKGNVAYDNAEQGIVLQRGAGSTSIEGWEDMLNHDILVIDNEVYNNGQNGILLKQVENNQIIGNKIYGNGADGIQIEGAQNNLIANNTITSNVYGIELRPYTGGFPGADKAVYNVVINNTITSVNSSIKENDMTVTINNTYAENIIAANSMSLGKQATVLADSDSLSYSLLQIIAKLPLNYNPDQSTGNETETPTTPEVPTTPTTPPVSDGGTVTPTTPTTPTTPSGTGLTVSGTEGHDTVRGGDNNDSIKGRGGDDVMFGGKGDDYLEGNDGNDFLYGGLGKDTLKGSAGIDTFVFQSVEEAGDTIIDFKADEKIDVSAIFQNNQNVTNQNALSNGYITLTQNGANVDVYVDTDGSSGSGAKVLLATLLSVNASNIKETHFIVKPNDTPTQTVLIADYTNSASAITVDLKNGTGLLDTLKNALHVIGSNLANAQDMIFGNDSNNGLFGLAGNDTLEGGKGADVLDGGSGWDYASYSRSSTGVTVNLLTGVHTGGDAQGDTLTSIEGVIGSNFDDTLTGGNGDDYLRGDNGNDMLSGGNGNDQLFGNAGNDTYLYSAGKDTINETTGVDRVVFDSALKLEQVRVVGNTLSFNGNDQNLITFNNITLIESFSFANHADMTLQQLLLQSAINTLLGDSAGGLLDSASTLNLSSSLTAVNVDLLKNTAYSAFDHVIGSNSATERDYIWGDNGSNKLYGMAGNDILEGGKGADYIDGGLGWDYARYKNSSAAVNINLETGLHTGGDAQGDVLVNIEAVVGSAFNDTLHGGNANDYLQGDKGNDVVTGGRGVDQLLGGAGVDTFLFENTSAFHDVDAIRDFSLSEGDKIDISDVLIGYDALHDAITDFVRITTSGSDSVLSIDANGTGLNFVQIATIQGVTGLTNEEALETSGTLITV